MFATDFRRTRAALRLWPGGVLLAALALAAVCVAGGSSLSPGGEPIDAALAARPMQPVADDGGAARIWFPASGGGPRAIRSMLGVRRAMAFGDFVWDDAGVPAGPLWIRVDLHRQLISLFRGGNEIATAVIIYGAQNKPTPIGRFKVIEKQADHHSAAYDAQMPYALFLTHDGVAIHASDVRHRNATHGCIGVPIEFARRLFDVLRVGDPVDIVAST